MVICLEHMAQLMPLPLTVSCFSKIQIGFNFLVLAHPVVPEKGPLNGCVCVCVCVCLCVCVCVCVSVGYAQTPLAFTTLSIGPTLSYSKMGLSFLFPAAGSWCLGPLRFLQSYTRFDATAPLVERVNPVG